MVRLQKILDLDFFHMEFYENYVLSRLKEDIIIDQKKVQKLVNVCIDHYGDKNFVYISKRVNNYNVNPTIYIKLHEINNLCGIAIVSQRTSSINMAHFEKNFAKIPFEVFLETEDAIKWALQKVKNKKADL